MFVRKYINTEPPTIKLEDTKNYSMDMGSILTQIVSNYSKKKEEALIKELFELSKKEQKYIREIVIIDENEFRDFLNTMLPIYREMKEGKDNGTI